MTHHIPDGLMHEAYQLYEGGHTSEEILTRFMNRGIDADIAEEVLSTVKAKRLKFRRSRGVIFAGIGVFTLVSAFAITYILHHFGYNTNWALYGLTTLGIVLLFIGMIYFMG